LKILSELLIVILNRVFTCLLLTVLASKGMERFKLELPSWQKEQRWRRSCMCH